MADCRCQKRAPQLAATSKSPGRLQVMAKNLNHFRLSPKEIARHKCRDCGVNVIKIGDYCMLSTDIWEGKLGMGERDNLCIACIEARLGRTLSLSLFDFTSFPSVEGFAPSQTLQDRLGFGTGKNARTK